MCMHVCMHVSMHAQMLLDVYIKDNIFICCFVKNSFYKGEHCTGQSLAHAWFLEIAFVRKVGMCVCFMCVCVCPPGY